MPAEAGSGAGRLPDLALEARPEPSVVRAVLEAGRRLGWDTTAEHLRRELVEAYRREREIDRSWYFLYRWADLFREG